MTFFYIRNKPQNIIILPPNKKQTKKTEYCLYNETNLPMIQLLQLLPKTLVLAQISRKILFLSQILFTITTITILTTFFKFTIFYLTIFKKNTIFFLIIHLRGFFLFVK